jgi:hypothetical protein
MMSLHFGPANEANHQINVVMAVLLIPSRPGHLQILHPHSWHCSLHDMPVPAVELQTYCELHDPPGLFDPVAIQNLGPKADP